MSELKTYLSAQEVERRARQEFRGHNLERLELTEAEYVRSALRTAGYITGLPTISQETKGTP